MDRIKSALFLDFDSIFGGLHSQDPQSAYDFAENSKEWLAALCAYGLPEDARRDLLIRRAYLNPYGVVKDKERGNSKGRILFLHFGPILIRAGFEVVNCFPLTKQQKNAADIRIVIDVLQSLNQTTLYDEFIIASSDSDFLPLLQCLRTHDRRTMIISSGQTVQAYRNASNDFIDMVNLVSTTAPQNENESSPVSQNQAQKAAEEESSAKNESMPANDPSSEPPSAEKESKPRESSKETIAENKNTTATKLLSESSATDARNKVLETARKLIANNKNATPLSELGQELRDRFAQEIEQEQGKWFGCATLSKFLLRNFNDLKQDGNFVWIIDKSQNPKNPAEELPETASKSSAENLPEIVAQICQIIDFPCLSAGHYGETLKMLARYAKNHEHEFKLSECTIWVRDQLKEKEIPVGRNAIQRIIHWAKHGGVSLDDDPPPNADKIREAVIQNAVFRAGEANLDLTPEGQKELGNWFQGNGNSA